MSDSTSEYWRKLLKIDEPVPDDFLKNVHSPLEILRPVFYFLIDLLCKLYFRVEVSGLKNVPKDPPYIIAPNHVSALDQTMVSYAIGCSRRRDLYTLTAKHFYDRLWARFFIKVATHAVRIDNVTDFLPALQAASKVLKLGKSLYINPEGTRSVTGELLPFKVGVGVLAVESGVPIVPVYIEGTYQALRPGTVIPMPVKVKVKFGKPIYMKEYQEKLKSAPAYDVYKEVTDELFKRVSSFKVR